MAFLTHPTCSRCRLLILEPASAAVVRVQRPNGKESRRVLCRDCAEIALGFLTVKPELATSGAG